MSSIAETTFQNVKIYPSKLIANSIFLKVKKGSLAGIFSFSFASHVFSDGFNRIYT